MKWILILIALTTGCCTLKPGDYISPCTNIDGETIQCPKKYRDQNILANLDCRDSYGRQEACITKGDTK